MFENNTYENLKNRILENYNLNLSKMEGSFLNDIASATALSHADFYVVLEKLLNIAFVKESYGDNLDKRANEFGVYRKEGKKAAGFITVTGENGTQIKYMDKFTFAGKNFYVVENQNIITIQDGYASVFVEAESVGKEYNVGQSAMFSTEIEGVETATRFATVVTGTDNETDEEFKSRFFYLQRHKGTSGNIDDYINWALEVDGVKNVKVIPLWNGNGTVKVIVMTDNNRNVDEEVVRNTQDYINNKKPIGASVTVVTPTILEVNISATVECNEKADLQDIKNTMRKITDLYLVEAAEEITYTKLMGLLSSVDGVIDFKDFKVNGRTSNIKLKKEQVGSAGEINLIKGDV